MIGPMDAAATPDPIAALPSWARARAEALRAELLRSCPESYRPPNVASDWDDGAIALEWWLGDESLAVYLQPDGTNYLRWYRRGGPTRARERASLAECAQRYAGMVDRAYN